MPSGGQLPEKELPGALQVNSDEADVIFQRQSELLHELWEDSGSTYDVWSRGIDIAVGGKSVGVT